MAVYTVLDREEIEAFIKPFGIGPLIDYEGVAAGIENTNYFLSTDQSHLPSELQTHPIQHFVLTIFENTKMDELRFLVALTTLLNQHNLPVPCPLKDADGSAINILLHKPALLVPRLAGEHPVNPSQQQCQTLGRTLACVHKVCMDSGLSHPGSRGLDWLEQLAGKLRPLLANADQALLDELPRFRLLSHNHDDLPQAVIHGDLFRDNTLFVGDTLTGLIDFNSAGSGYLLFDLAVVINDWCSRPDGALEPSLAHALLTAYQQVRPLTVSEKQLWNDFLRIAAVRFWISRRYSQLQPENSHRTGCLVEAKDPQQYRAILLQRIRHPMLLA